MLEAGAPTETACWTKPRNSPRVEIVRLEIFDPIFGFSTGESCAEHLIAGHGLECSAETSRPSPSFSRQGLRVYTSGCSEL
jgi:hypothetical protein